MSQKLPEHYSLEELINLRKDITIRGILNVVWLAGALYGLFRLHQANILPNGRRVYNSTVLTMGTAMIWIELYPMSRLITDIVTIRPDWKKVSYRKAKWPPALYCCGG